MSRPEIAALVGFGAFALECLLLLLVAEYRGEDSKAIRYHDMFCVPLLICALIVLGVFS